MTEMNSPCRTTQKTYATCRIHTNSREKLAVKVGTTFLSMANWRFSAESHENRSNSSIQWVLRNHCFPGRSIYHASLYTGSNNDRRKVSIGSAEGFVARYSFLACHKHRVLKSQPNAKKWKLYTPSMHSRIQWRPVARPLMHLWTFTVDLLLRVGCWERS